MVFHWHGRNRVFTRLMNPPAALPPNAVVMRARVDLDIAVEDRARAELQAACRAAPVPGWVLVCFEDDCFVDVRGVQIFLDAAAQAAVAGGRFGVVAPPRSLRRIVTVLGLDELPIFDSWAAISPIDDSDSTTTV